MLTIVCVDKLYLLDLSASPWSWEEKSSMDTTHYRFGMVAHPHLNLIYTFGGRINDTGSGEVMDKKINRYQDSLICKG